MDSVDFFQVFIIIIILIITLFYIYFRSLTSSSSSTSSVAADDDTDTDTPPLQEKYDVFLNFRGEDTRDGFTSHLHAALRRKQIETYIDNRLEKGDDIGPALLKAIERSKIALVIFSKDYASSTWCLKELVHILECKKSYGQIVIPIFYRIDPLDVRKQQGTYALEEDRLRKRSRDEVANWRAALEEASYISGFHFHDSSKTGTEADFVEEVVQDVLTKLNRELSYDLKGLFGIERKIKQIESLLCLDSPGVCCVGIWGMGGIGKTTLADAVFHRQSSKFEAACFLANVRENSEQTNGLHQLRNKLVGEILKEKDINIDTLSIGQPSIRNRLRHTKALIVLDDVNDPSQLDVLVGAYDQFDKGSQIIITARDKGVLEQKVDHEKIYKVDGLSSDEALQLFHSQAFRNKSPTTEYNALSIDVVDYINGIPLGLKVMGSLFLGCKSKQEWKNQLKKLKRFPSEQINKVLRVSYDGLGENEREIFLEIACFHKGCQRNYVKELLDSRDFCGEVGIKVLIDKSLISISKARLDMESEMESERWIDTQSGGWIKMHDLVQEMGRAIAREQRIRLFDAEDVYEVLTNNQRDGHVQAIFFDLSKIEKLHLELEHANFGKMNQLKGLHVSNLPSIFTSPGQSRYLVSLDLPNSLRYLKWNRYPLKSLPSEFSTQNLVVLEMTSSKVGARLWTEKQSPVNLKWIYLGDSQLTEVPNLSRSLNIEHINLNGCASLVEIPSYFQDLGKLTYLDLGRCTKLKKLHEMPRNLEFLNLSLTAIKELPSSVWSHEKISHLGITYCRDLKSLPSNSCKLKLSGSLSLEGCESLCEVWELPRDTRALDWSLNNLVSLRTNICKLKSLESLDLSLCRKFQNFPEISEVVEHLKFLNLSFTAVKELPPSIGNLVALRKLDLCHCNNLESLPELPSSLESLDLSWCSKFQNFPEISEAMEHLEFLKLSVTAVKELPLSIGNLVALRKLDLSSCDNLEYLPELPSSLESLDLTWCSKFQNFPEISEAMEHLEFLKLSGTAVKDLPPSIGNLVALRQLNLSDCNNLESFPKLPSSLESLDLSRCSKFQNFPEISEAMEHLESLKLSATAVKELPPSIGNLVALRKLDLCHCNNLESLPELPSSLKSLDLSYCSKFQNFPEISEAMERLEFLNLKGTAVKEVPQSIGNLVALRKLDLSYCKNLEVFPDHLVRLTSLQELNMSLTKIKSIRASIKQAAQLSRLHLFDCKSLESLPELPPLLQCLEAHGCTSLKTVSSSSIAITQGWEEYIFSRGLYEKYIFSNCPKLDENAQSNIMADAQLRIMRMATASSKFKEDNGKRSLVVIRCWGYEIPKWFSHQSEGSSIKIELPRDWFSTDFLGFALSLVVGYAKWGMEFGCEYNFKTSNGESHEVNQYLCSQHPCRDSYEVFVWWYNNVFEEVVEGAPSPTVFYNSFTEVNVDFNVLTYEDTEEVEGVVVEVEKCGICLLYGKDAEMIKQRNL